MFTLEPACLTNFLGIRNEYFTAKALVFYVYDWKEFGTIYVNNNKIVTVEYNTKNASGFIRS